MPSPAPSHPVDAELVAATRDLTLARESGDPAAEAVARWRAHRAAAASGVATDSWWHYE